ncbi:MAG: hypothetical protein U0234_19955 [Sandaracinus sp.]
MPRLALALASLVLSLALGPVVRAQPPPAPPDHVERRTAVLEGDVPVRVATRWSAETSTSGTSIAIGDAAPVVLVRGASAAAVEAGEHGAIVAYESYEDAHPFRWRTIRRVDGHDVLGDEHTTGRPIARAGDIPFAVAIAAIPGRGFALFFEEIQSDDPTAARTYLLVVDADGAPSGPMFEIAVPWPLAGAAWDGSGYHLALIYPGGGGGMRLSMVQITEQGAPRQHPDWSSEPGEIADVHLVTEGASVVAHYRRDTHWLAADVTAIASWGQNRRHATEHGTLGEGVTIGADGAGHLTRIAEHDDGLAPAR